MELNEYQKQALTTDQVPDEKEIGDLTWKIVPLLGLAGEVGELLSEYKKSLRDGPAHKLFTERVEEELGDLLWYIANLAYKFDLNLNTIAEKNLNKVRKRFASSRTVNSSYCFDEGLPESERLPRQFEVQIEQIEIDGSPRVRVFFNGQEAGDPLTDNSHDPDGYRFHDVFHLAHAAVLGWSPVTRYVLDRKRRSNKKLDEVEDGGRAIAIEEGVTALIFSYAQTHNFLKDITELDYSLLRNIFYLTAGLEVKVCSTGDWERAILLGYEVWRQVFNNQGGKVIGDIDNQTLLFEKL